MFKSCFRRSLSFVFLLTLSTTSLLATSFGTEDEDSRPINSVQHIDHLSDELHLYIFSFLPPKDAASVTQISRRWERLMEVNQLWEVYARRAHIISKEDPFLERNYKALVKDHCTFSFTDLGTLNGGTWSIALGISSDGSVIVGQAADGAAQNQRRAFRWTAEKGMESLGTLNGGRGSWAQGISADGSVIVGEATDGISQNQLKAFRWTAGKGMESVEKMLTDKGLLPSQWILTKVNAITPSGTVLIGEGKYKDTSNRILTRVWRAVIPRGNLF